MNSYNEDSIERLSKIAQTYPDVIFSVSVGNENTPDESEKHWGLYNEDRTPKPVVKELLK